MANENKSADSGSEKASRTEAFTKLQMQQVIEQLHQRSTQSEAALGDTQKTVRVLGGSFAVCILATVISAWVLTSKYPLDRYIHTDNAKAICEAQTSDQPLITTNTVMEFAKDCALEIDTFGHDSVEQNLSRMANRCLTPNFRQQFFQASWLGDRISTVKQGLFRVSSQTTGPVLVESSGLTADGYMWRIQIPIKRTYRQGEMVKGNNERTYVMDVYRVIKDAYNPVGLGINAVVEKSANR